ncbi:MAG: HEPN domain-containing protein [Nitrospirae bacterium]|nr:HEPN domain-containing protein [Nitrospirota bacterium]
MDGWHQSDWASYGFQDEAKIDMMSAINEKIIKGLYASAINIKAGAHYSSYARNSQNPDSDIDLLLISDEIDIKRHKRGKEAASITQCLCIDLPFDILLLTSDECLSNFRNHNPLFSDIAYEGRILIDEDDFLIKLMEETKVYIYDRKIEKLADGWRFPVLYRRPTYLSDVSNKDFAKVMFTDGELDFKIGNNIMEDGYYDKAVYHFQQSVEKAVKTVLISFGDFKKSHFVGGILTDKLKEVQLVHGWKKHLLRVAEIIDEVEIEVTWSRYPGIDNGVLWIPYE